ncbi:MAG: hypothetical protein MPJ24_09605 [Pirellulaceae bacterium]|nr:hypothetical protein [Pirellulaceae bacterium]
MRKLQFSSFNEYRSSLKNEEFVRSDDRIAIMAGHFMLGYEPKQARLEPLIFQDAATDEFQHFSKLMANDFPLSTFQNGLSILDDLTPLTKESKIFLLVNDHRFTDPVFQPVYHPTFAD